MKPTTHLKLDQVDRVDLASDPLAATPMAASAAANAPQTQQQQQAPRPSGQQAQNNGQRIDHLFAALDRNLSKRVQDDGAQTRIMVDNELDGVARAINGLEGTIRIDLRPEIEAAVRDALDKRGVGSSRPIWRALRVLALVAAGIAIGAFAHAEIQEGASVIASLISGVIS